MFIDSLYVVTTYLESHLFIYMQHIVFVIYLL